MFFRRKKNTKNVEAKKHIELLNFSGVLLLINNAIIIIRILINNYRSFSEFRLQIILNYPLMLLAIILAIPLIKDLNQSKISTRTKLFGLTTLVVVFLFTVMLFNWQFFKILN